MFGFNANVTKSLHQKENLLFQVENVRSNLFTKNKEIINTYMYISNFFLGKMNEAEDEADVPDGEGENKDNVADTEDNQNSDNDNFLYDFVEDA